MQYSNEVLSNEGDWLKTLKQLEEQWNFPNGIDALDGKYVNIKCRGANFMNTRFYYFCIKEH